MDKIRVLIVDDSSVTRKIIDRSLRKAGVELGEVMEASTGLEALAVLADSTVDLIISDINMPEMNGIQFIRRLQNMESARSIPVVMITMDGSESLVVQALSAGARGYIRKPFTPEQVRDHVMPLLISRCETER